MVAAAMLSLTLLAGACSGDEEAEETTTTAASEGSEGSEDSTSTTVAELSDEEFAAKADEALDAVTAAGTDLCELFDATSSALGPEAPPSSPEQVRITVELQVALLKAIAASEPVVPESKATIDRIADELAAAASSAEYSEDFFNDGALAGIINGQELVTALTPYQTRYQSECAPTTSMP
jgi:hypothetical protein